MKIIVFLSLILWSYWKLFLLVQLKAMMWTNDGPVYWHICASLGFSELKHYSLTMVTTNLMTTIETQIDILLSSADKIIATDQATLFLNRLYHLK